MKIQIILFSLLTLIYFKENPLSGLASSDPILVELTTESQLSPLYLFPIMTSTSEFDERYLRQLESIISFDLDHNGYMFLPKSTLAMQKLSMGSEFENLGDITPWKQLGIHYLVKVQVTGKELKLKLVNISDKTSITTSPIAISGDISQDRRTIHSLMDSVVKTLFGTEGIASTKILYTIKEKTPQSHSTGLAEIWEADYDGANTHKITQENSFCVTPVCIPPKQGFTSGGFLYTSYRNGQPKIYAASFKDGTGKRTIHLRGNQLMPAISLQRDKLAFISDVTGNPDLFLQNFSPESGPSGKPYQIFSAKQATQSSPTFSPDGKKVAFVSDKDGAPRIYLIDIPLPGVSLNTIKATLLTKRNRESSAPSWSPNGKKIAYCSKTGAERQIWVYDFDTQTEKQVTQGPVNKENPSWAPNSLHLVYNSSDKENSDLYIMHLNGSEPVKITTGMGEKRFPNWEPR